MHELAGLDLGAVVPERGGLDLDEVADDEPVELREPEPLCAPVRRSDRGVLARDDVAADAAAEHPLHRPVVRVVVVDQRQVVEAEVVVGGGRVAPPRLQQRDDVRVGAAPAAGRRRRALDVPGQATLVVDARHREVAGQRVVQRRDVGRALDRRVPAQREDAAARPADVAEQELDDRRGADDLRAGRVLREADRVHERARPLAARVAADRLGVPEELLDRAAARVRDGLGRVAREVPLQDLEHATRVLERLVLLAREPPGRGVVPPALGVPAGEEPVEVLGVGELLAHDRARVRVPPHVLVEPEPALEDVAHDAAEERDVAARADADEPRRGRARPREARVDVDDLGAALARLHHPLERDRMVLGHVRAHDRDHVRVDEIRRKVVAPPRPNVVPRPGTVELCHMRAWFSTCTTPSAVRSFLIR